MHALWFPEISEQKPTARREHAIYFLHCPLFDLGRQVMEDQGTHHDIKGGGWKRQVFRPCLHDLHLNLVLRYFLACDREGTLVSIDAHQVSSGITSFCRN